MGNKKRNFIADTGTCIPVCSINFARKNGIQWRELNPDEPKYSGVTGTELTILGQAAIKEHQELESPCVQATGRGIHERQGSICSKLEFRKIDEDNYDMDKDISKLKRKLLSKFKDVFKSNLEPNNSLNIPPVEIQVNNDPSMQ